MAKSWNGVDFAVKANNEGKLKQEADVSIVLDYSLSVNFQVPSLMKKVEDQQMLLLRNNAW